MEKYNWRDDPELRLWLMDSAPAPKAVRSPKFDSLFRFVIRKKTAPWKLKILFRNGLFPSSKQS